MVKITQPVYSACPSTTGRTVISDWVVITVNKVFRDMLDCTSRTLREAFDASSQLKKRDTIPGMRVGRHGGYSREIRHHAWQIETGSWWCEMHWLLWQKKGSPGSLHFRYLSAKNYNPY